MFKKSVDLICLFGFLSFFVSCQLTETTLKTVSQKNSNTRSQTLEVKPIWVSDLLSQKNLGYRKINRFSPILYKDMLITANSMDGLKSFDILDQSLKWSFKIENGVESSGAVINSRLFVGGLNGIFYSIDLDSGQVIWEFDTKSEVAAEPLIQDGYVYFVSGGNILYCLDATNGRQIWVYNRQDNSNRMTIRGGAKPAYYQGLIYQGFSDGSLVSLSSKTGTPQWEVLINRNTKFKDIDASAVVEQDTIYINSYDDKIYAVSRSSGTILWSSPNGGYSAPIISGDRLIYTSSKGQLIAVAKKTGDVIWKKSDLAGLATEPTLHKGLVVVGESQGSVKFFDFISGELRGSFDPGRGVLTRPVSDKGQRIYFISGESNIYALQVKMVSDNLNFPYIR